MTYSGDSIVTGSPLQALVRNADGTYRLSFSGTPALTADHVVLVLPVSLLRQVDTSWGRLRRDQAEGDRRAGHGTNS